MHSVTRVPTPADLRAEIARRRIPLFELAALVSVHPSRLGRMLNGRVPLTDELAQRIAAALDADEAQS